MTQETNCTIEPRDRAQTIVAYLKNDMTPTERGAFEARIAEDEGLQAEVERTKAILDIVAASSASPIVQLVNNILKTAISRMASDIHLVPERGQKARLLFRIDGVLHDVDMAEVTDGVGAGSLPFSQFQAVVDRIKTMTDMNLSERRVPQDGRIPLKHQDKNFNVHATVLPTLYGERVTMRIILQTDVLLGLDKLGLQRPTTCRPSPLDSLATGPYSRRRLGRQRENDVTLLPVARSAGTRRANAQHYDGREIKWEMAFRFDNALISQIAIDKKLGMTYAANLRSILRSDPDIIYCSEMPDVETAELCLNAALTGHLVLSAVPASGAISVVEWLRYRGIANYQIADSIVGLIGLRLVSKAGGTGRVPLMEVVEITQSLRRRIAEGADTAALTAEAFPNGGKLSDDAAQKVADGLITDEAAAWALFDYNASTSPS